MARALRTRAWASVARSTHHRLGLAEMNVTYAFEQLYRQVLHSAAYSSHVYNIYILYAGKTGDISNLLVRPISQSSIAHHCPQSYIRDHEGASGKISILWTNHFFDCTVRETAVSKVASAACATVSLWCLCSVFELPRFPSCLDAFSALFIIVRW